ncbi:L-dopachrome tautomerase-related protein [Asaia spathodeae]|uniref:Major royal jelly protein n=1 Tax=Asaia spathodeae TaxID=657016 RepID=A0ABX2P324_9PROT|nr:L-dopachrome tautomerase-related protein [Asaia spathodeae]GBR13765.1 gluconolactonase [Asaia spathodeae NBRC 105894]
MVAFLPKLRRSACCTALFTLALTLRPVPAQAAHERPWLADTAAAKISQTISLPGKALWRQALPLADGSVILLREPASDENGPFLARLAAGASETTPLIPVWSSTDDKARGPKGFAPSALACDDSGTLWLIDRATAGFPPRLIHLDPVSGKVLSELDLPPEAIVQNTAFTTLAVHGQTAYLADEGGVSLTMVDMARHQATRFFAGYPTSRGHLPLTIDHHPVMGTDGHPLTRDIAYLALETNGKWLYEQAPTGPIFRLSTDLLTDPSVTPSEQMEGVTQWRGTPTVSGMTLDDKATLYLTDIENGRLLSFDTARLPHILLVAPQLVQAGIPGWARSRGDNDKSGQIWVPAGHTLLRIDLP